MPRLIHLNGPPGIGKSTISALYADRHPGTLNLDIDSLHGLVGGWRDPAQQTHGLLRPVAKAMAAAHLRGGRDVVLPQYLARLDEINDFERLATEQGADFLEFVLLDTKEESLARFERRPNRTSWDQYNRDVVAQQGGPQFLARMYDRLLEITQLRASAVILRSDVGAIEATYELLITALPGPARRER